MFVKTFEPSGCDETKVESSYKVWCCLFTCFVTRAIHLELVKGLTTNAFLQALLRFSSRQGLPTTIYSDNARTFTAADKELKALLQGLEWERIGNSSSTHGVEWKYSFAEAPWTNGLTERMIKTVKRSLKIMLGNARLTFLNLRLF